VQFAVPNDRNDSAVPDLAESDDRKRKAEIMSPQVPGKHQRGE